MICGNLRNQRELKNAAGIKPTASTLKITKQNL